MEISYGSNDSTPVVGLTWGVGNHLSIFSTVYPAREESIQRFSPNSIIQIGWETTLYVPQVRKLVNEALGTFIALQDAAKGTLTLPQLLKVSRQYRSVIKACIEDLNKADESNNPDENGLEDLEQLSEVFYKLELVWNLCEVLYIDKDPSGIVLPQLLEWIRLHFPAADQQALEAASSGEASEHPEYWLAMQGLLLQGQLDKVRRLLQLHPQFDHDGFQSIDELLRKMPVHGASATMSLAEFEFRWRHWQSEVRARRSAGDFLINPRLNFLAQILAGEEEVWETLRPQLETWYEEWVGRLLYTDPCITLFRLKEEASQAWARFQENASGRPLGLDAVILTVLQNDWHDAIGLIQSNIDNSWATAHLADLLFHAEEVLGDPYSFALRENLLRDFAVCLLSHQSLWITGLRYLDYCPSWGPACQETFIPALLYNASHQKATQLLHFAQKRNLRQAALSVCRIMGRRCLNEKRLGQALSWALRGPTPDSQLASAVADQCLDLYLKEAAFPSAASSDLLSSLGAGILASDRLAFLGKYREFHKLYGQREFRDAAVLLVGLLTSRIAPHYFWPVLLTDSLPLLEANPPVFTSEETLELMQCVQELQALQKDGTQKTTNVDTKSAGALGRVPFLDEEKDKLLALALSRNLARSFLLEGSA